MMWVTGFALPDSADLRLCRSFDQHWVFSTHANCLNPQATTFMLFACNDLAAPALASSPIVEELFTLRVKSCR